MFHVRKQEGVGGARVVRVVDDEVRFGDAVAELDDFNVAVGLATNSLVVVFAENEGLTVLELNDVFAARVALGEVEPRAVIENVAVLQNFDECGTLVRGSVLQRFFEVLLENVNRARDKSGLRADSERNTGLSSAHRCGC
jgi:hypothetical protein